MAQYIKIASCQVILLPSEIMGTNLKLEQVDRLFQSSAEPSQTAQIRVMNSDRDEKVSVLSVFTSVGSLTRLRYWIQYLQLQEQKAPPAMTVMQ